MLLNSIRLNFLIGPSVPVPAPLDFVEAVDRVEASYSDTGRSGFQITLRIGRSGPADLLDYSLVLNPLLRPFNRLAIVVTMGIFPQVLVDGVITHQQLNPGQGPGTATLTITGEDASVLMDLEEKSVEHPGQDETIIATKIIASHTLIPMVIPPVTLDPPLPIERTPVQQGTDLQYLRQMAARHGHVFYVMPGPTPLAAIGYWGPPERTGLPQRALSVEMGAETNVESISFQNNALSPGLVAGQVLDRMTNQQLPVRTFASTRVPMVSQPSWLVNQPNVRTMQFRHSGVSAVQAFGRAQAMTDRAADDTVTATGQLDAVRYGDLLRPRGVVGLRGVGYSHGGNYYVKEVTHTIDHQSYKQSFTLTREGLGALIPAVIP